MSIAKTEHVLVIPTELFHQVGHFQGFCDDTERYLTSLLGSDQVTYRPRPDMERDPLFKQLIPYVIFQFVDDEEDQFVFQYTRGRGQGEQRLHSKLSIGVGGHISSDDGQCVSGNPYLEGMQRELAEEVRIETEYDDRCVGLINDDETDVGKVHLGVVHLLTVVEPQVFANEVEMTEAGFRHIDELRDAVDRMETWSKICFEALFGLC